LGRLAEDARRERTAFLIVIKRSQCSLGQEFLERGFLIGEQGSWTDADRGCQQEQLMERDVLGAALDVGDRGSRKTDPLGDLALGETGFRAASTQSPAELLVEAVHLPIMTSALRNVNLADGLCA
jgi:hypothetical protein